MLLSRRRVFRDREYLSFLARAYKRMRQQKVVSSQTCSLLQLLPADSLEMRARTPRQGWEVIMFPSNQGVIEYYTRIFAWHVPFVRIP